MQIFVKNEHGVCVQQKIVPINIDNYESYCILYSAGDDFGFDCKYVSVAACRVSAGSLKLAG